MVMHDFHGIKTMTFEGFANFAYFEHETREIMQFFTVEVVQSVAHGILTKTSRKLAKS